MTTTAAAAPNRRAAYATSGVGTGLLKYLTVKPAAVSTPTVSSMNAALESRASRPTTTGPGVPATRGGSRQDPCVARMTTARFIRFEPASTFPRSPAVPKASVPSMRSASSSYSPTSMRLRNSARVAGSGSPSIHRRAAFTRSEVPSTDVKTRWSAGGCDRCQSGATEPGHRRATIREWNHCTPSQKLPIDQTGSAPSNGPAPSRDWLDETFDLVIIGAGVVGAGAALDAATRGMSVAMIEQRDYASGTSSRSSKLIHGGLRYLEQLNFRLVMEALRERGLLINKTAPHLIRPLSFLYPLTHRVWERLYVGAGILMYDLLAATGDNPLPRHRHMTKRTALETMPSLDPSTLVGAIQYYDAQVDDARHTMVLARTAAGHGAVTASSVRATGIVREGDRVVGVEARDLETGRDFVVKGRATLNATGVWTDSIQDMVGCSSGEGHGLQGHPPRGAKRSDPGRIRFDHQDQVERAVPDSVG